MSSTVPTLPKAHPPLGTIIDNGAYELIEVLGVGGYGVVYRAVDALTPYPRSYAVKCLMHSSTHSRSRRSHHIREIALHQIASGHPGVVTLHKVVQDYDYTYIIMDYAPDHDLFTQILNNRRYLGDDVIIKDIFLQLLDAVEYIHSLGIYHRDLKPENILCFEDGDRIALTDFGLATTDKTSSEFRTGSVYHMSPECQGGEFSPTGIYSPRFNDIWSLGIILLNLATGRNPWKSATSSDPTFQAYLQDPYNFLPSVLPISAEVNDILVRVLAVDWRKRMSLRQLRRAIENVDSFYSGGVVFEGSLARCPWEVGLDYDLDASDEASVSEVPPRRAASAEVPRSCWSNDTDDGLKSPFTAMVVPQGTPWSPTEQGNGRPTWLADTLGLEEELSPDDQPPSITHSPTSPAFSDGPSDPATPNSSRQLFSTLKRNSMPASRQKLTLNTTLVTKPCYYDATVLVSPGTADEESLSSSSTSSMMQTAVEYDSYASSFVLASPRGSSLSLPTSESIHFGDVVEPHAKDLISVVPWNYSTTMSVATSSMASMEFTSSHYPSKEESDKSAIALVDRLVARVGQPSVAPREYIIWPDFYDGDGDGDDGGRGTSVGESCRPNIRDMDEASSYDGVLTTRPRSPHPQQSNNRRSSEPWLSDLFHFGQQHHQGYSEDELSQLEIGLAQNPLTLPASAESGRGQPKSQNAHVARFLPAIFQFDRREHRGGASARHGKPWFLPTRFFPKTVVT